MTKSSQAPDTHIFSAMKCGIVQSSIFPLPGFIILCKYLAIDQRIDVQI